MIVAFSLFVCLFVRGRRKDMASAGIWVSIVSVEPNIPFPSRDLDFGLCIIDF